MKSLPLILIFLLLFSTYGFSQENDEFNYHSPLGIPLVLSSNFGELRPNHFHMGLDFKTNNKIGYKIYAIEEGFVSRIKVSPYGYGKVVYIDHPNGITSVYAHCSEFKGAIDSLVRQTQQNEQNFAVEIFPGKGILKVQKGEVIALSGNTGGSTAPHLHFEVRDTKTEHALNPLVFGFDIKDTKAPEIRTVKVYALTKDGYRIPDKSTSKAVIRGKTGNTVGNYEIIVPSDYSSATGGIGIAVDVIDRFDAAANRCGLYGSYLIVDGDTLFGQKSDRIPFESTRYVNSHKDYEAYQLLSKKYHKCFRTKENDLPIYINNNLGVIKVQPGDQKKIKYIAFDVSGNESVLEFTLKVSAGNPNPRDGITLKEDHLHPAETYHYQTDSRELEFGYATVYEPISLDKADLDHQIAERPIPVNRAYKIKIKCTDSQDGKHYIEIITNKSRKKALAVQYKDGWAYAESKYFGSYSLKRDETAPTVTSVSFTKQSTSTTRTKLQWRISDVASGIADYDLFIDGQWHLLEYDYKTGMVTFNRPENFKGSKEIQLLVKDECGNITEWKTSLAFN